VTSLEDSGPGTFREAVEQGGARIVVFNVSGIIHLETPVIIRAPYLTIAGQTAPGDGVAIAGETVQVDTHDVIIRHMRFRRGITDVTRRDDALDASTPGNVIFDHVSASWGLDETLSIYRNVFHYGDGERMILPTSNITVQNSIIAEGLDTYNHAFGSTIGGINCTLLRNLYANNISRNPSIGMWGDFTFVNNVLFNWWNRTVDGGDHRSAYNIINNYYKPGPITGEGPGRHRVLRLQTGHIDTLAFGLAYVEGNIIEGNEEVTADNWAGGVQLREVDEEGTPYFLQYIRTDRPSPFLSDFTVMPAEEAFDFVLDHAGATIPKRDEVDERVVWQTRTGEINNTAGEVMDTGTEFDEFNRRLPDDSFKDGIIIDIAQVGGFPEYSGTPYEDSSGDGIPDWWKIKYGLDPNDPSDATEDMNGDGYTNIEMYINGMDPTTSVDWTDLENNKDTLRERGGLTEEYWD